jgi:hypothetical protein
MSNETTKIAKCNCDNPGQDGIHGVKNRVFNQTSKSSKKKGESGEYVCTVCNVKIKLIN